MKSLNFQKLSLRKEDFLSKTQMKNILGGYGDGSGDGTCNCNSADDCTATNELCMNSCSGKPEDTYQGKCGCP